MPSLVASDKARADGIVSVKETTATRICWAAGEENSNVTLHRGENFHGKI